MKTESIQKLNVNFDRLKDDIERFARIGQGEDGGIYRTGFSEADFLAREALQNALADCGVESHRDGAGNVIGRIDADGEQGAVLVGSHLDTVPAAGSLDGALGVLCGLECLRRIREENLPINHPIELIAFSDEEGRFGGMFGSQALAGLLNPELIKTAIDLNGVRLGDAMEERGMDPWKALTARREPTTVQSYIELHIEQGPVLDRLGKSIGVVEAISGLFKWVVRLKGEADHAGTTPMPVRSDAFAGLAEFSGEIPRILEENGKEESVATIGMVSLSPGTANTVPGLVEFSLDVRDVESQTLADLGDAFRRALSAIARRRGLMFEFDVISEITPVACDARIRNTIAKSAELLGFEPHLMPSGAAHDAQVMAKLCPVGMVFVPSVGGRSHSPAEWTHWADIEAGANVLLHSVMRLAGAV